MKSCPACNTRYDDQTTYCVKDGSPVVPDVLSPQAPMIGQLIGDRYRIIRKIGEGGMGEVYVAEHIHIEKKVALKLLRPEVLSNAEAVARFRQEARSASAIGHDNIITIDDFGTMPDGRVYMAMEYLQGAPLNEMIAKEPLPLPRALDILIQVGRGLAAAHAKGITHRDMKPENVFVTNKEGRDVPKILDFGIAKVSGGDTAQNLTVAGTIFGTPFYMAPEQAMGGKMDHRVDIYAMGIILYEVFCGEVPFKAETFMGILTQHITMAPVPPSEMAGKNGRVCAHELEAIILKAIQKDVNARYQSMGELVNALIEFYRFAVGPGAVTAAPWAGGFYGTTSASMGAVTGKKKGRGALIAGIVVAALVVLGGGAAVVIGSSGKGEPQKGKVPAAAVDAGSVAKASTPDAGHVAKAATPDAAVAAAAAPDAGKVAASDTIEVKVDSTPPEAAVLRDGTYIGNAPVSIPVAKGKTVKVTMRLKGFKDETFTIDGSKTLEHHSLTAAGRDKPTTPKPQPANTKVNPDLKSIDDDGLAPPSKK